MKWLAILFAVLIIVIIILADAGTLPRYLGPLYDYPYGDKVGHFLLFGFLSLFLNLHFLSRLALDKKRIFPRLNLILCLLIGLEELSQYFFPSRTLDLIDLLCSWAGVISFAWVAWRILKGKKIAS